MDAMTRNTRIWRMPHDDESRVSAKRGRDASPHARRTCFSAPHSRVTNMPGAVPLTATEALNKATLSYVLELANKGIEIALSENLHLANGLNIKNGKVVHEAVKEALTS